MTAIEVPHSRTRPVAWVSVSASLVAALLFLGSAVLQPPPNSTAGTLIMALGLLAMAACVFLIGNTLLGYLVASYGIAPLFSGGSHDTAAWSETVVAASAAAAGIAMIVAAATTVRRGARPAAG